MSKKTADVDTETGEIVERASARLFAEFLAARPETHLELSADLADLARAVLDTGKAGSITYTVTIKAMRGSDNQVLVSDSIKKKLPEHDRADSVMFSDECGLTRHDPRQLAIEGLREVPVRPVRTTTA